MPKTESPPADLLTVEEFAAAIRMSKMTIYRAIEAGTITAIALGRTYRIPRTELDRVLSTPIRNRAAESA